MLLRYLFGVFVILLEVLLPQFEVLNHSFLFIMDSVCDDMDAKIGLLWFFLGYNVLALPPSLKSCKNIFLLKCFFSSTLFWLKIHLHKISSKQCTVNL